MIPIRVHSFAAALAAVCSLVAQDAGKQDPGKQDQGKQEPGKQAGEEQLPAAQDLRAGGNEHMRYFLVDKRGDVGKQQAPRGGFKLLCVLPGGDGSADFATFVRRIAANATDDEWLVAQLVAPVWKEEQAKTLVWPTRKTPFDGMEFATEDFLAAVIRDVESRHAIDPAVVFTLSWSSSGPAAYAASLDPEIGVTGSFVAMSVWKPEQLPPLAAAKGHGYYLLHSPQDFIPIAMPTAAKVALSKVGAAVEFAQYQGGHGWQGDVYGTMRTGLDWLATNHAKPTKKRLAESKAAEKARKLAAAKPQPPAAPADGKEPRDPGK